jgi:hypothetical protein
MKTKIYSLGVAIFLGCGFASGQTWHKYTFNSGNANNDVAAVNNGTVTGAVLTTDRFGNANKAYDFGTTGTSKIDCGNITIMNNTANLTITGWYQKPANTVIREMFCKPDAAGSIRARTYNDATQLYGYSGTQFTGAPTNATNYTSIATGTWFHFALVINTTTNSMKTYINGVQYSQGSAGTTGGTLPFLIGNVPAAMSTGQGWQGKLDDIFMVNRSLSVTQIDSLRNLPNPVAPTVWLKYSFNAGTTVNDLGANNTGTLSAGSLTTDRFGNANQAYTAPDINCGTVSNFIASPKFTFTGWFKKPAALGTYAMYSLDNNYSVVYVGDQSYQNAPIAANAPKSTIPYSNPTYSNIAVGDWFHYAAVIDPATGGILKNYINGVQFSTSTSNAGVLNGTGNLQLGSPFTSSIISFSGSQWPTAMDDIFAVNAVLSVAQIDSLRNLSNPGQVNTNTCVANAPVNITPQANLTLCSGTPLTLSVTASGTVKWYTTPTGTTSIATGSVYTTPILASGNYTYYTDNTEACGTSNGRTPISFVINSTPTVTALLSNNGAICITGTGVTLTLSGAATYTVSNGVTTYTSTGGVSSLYPTSTTVYTINGTSAQGCLNPLPVSATVNVSSNPTITASNGTICSGSFFTINPSGATSYTYSGGGSAVVSPTTNTTYVVTGSNGVCSSTKNVTVTVNPLPNSSINIQNQPYCPNAVTNIGFVINSVTVAVNGSPAAQDQFFNYTYSAATTQTLNFVYTNTLTGCTRTQTPIVYNVLSNTITISSSAANPICSGQSAILTASVAGTPANLAWSNAPVFGNTTTITPTITTTYTISGQDQAGYGCNYSATYTQSVTTCTGIEEATHNNLVSIYPNPANDFMTVSLAAESTDATTIYIINALGETVLTEKATSSNTTLNTSNLTSGIYFIKVESKNSSAIKKFIKN